MGRQAQHQETILADYIATNGYSEPGTGNLTSYVLNGRDYVIESFGHTLKRYVYRALTEEEVQSTLSETLKTTP